LIQRLQKLRDKERIAARFVKNQLSQQFQLIVSGEGIGD